MSIAKVDMKLEVVVIPVSDVDRAKEFYGRLGWRLDADFPFDNGFRVVQFTPPGSGPRSSSARTSRRPRPARPRACTWSSPTSRLRARSSSPAESKSARCSTPGRRALSSSPTAEGRVSGPATDHASYGSFATFSDPDGNGWLLQEITTRLPGRIDPATTRSDRPATWRARCAVRRPPTASTRSAPRAARRDWPDWYAAYMVAEQAGTELPT